LGINLLFALVALAVDAQARTLTVDGTAVLEDGKPVVAGTVIFREVKPQISASGMPAMHPVSVQVTDAEGRFRAVLADIKGSLDIRLVQDHCDWTGAVTEVSSDEIRKNDHLTVKLEPRRESCKDRGETK
jgi:hypothetical protein